MRESVLPTLLVTLGLASGAFAAPLTISNLFEGQFIDISASSGTALGLMDDEERLIASSVSNIVFSSGSLVVGNNGAIAFGLASVEELSPLNEPIPSNAAFQGAQSVMPYWDDIDDKSGEVYFGIVTHPDFGPTTVVQWHNRPLNSIASGLVRFQVQVFGNVGSDDIVAQFIYDDIETPGPNGGAGATIGYQDGGAGFEDALWSFNTAGAVSNGTVLSVTAPEPSTMAFLFPAMILIIRKRKDLA